MTQSTVWREPIESAGRIGGITLNSDLPSRAALISSSASEMMNDADIILLPQSVRKNLEDVSTAVIRSMRWTDGARIALFGNEDELSAEIVVSDTSNKRELRITVYDHKKVDVWMRWVSGKRSLLEVDIPSVRFVAKVFQAM